MAPAPGADVPLAAEAKWFESGLKALGQSLSLAVWWSGWLALGVLGRRHAPLVMDGITPLALWLCSMAATARLANGLCCSSARISGALAAASLGTCLALLWACAGGGAAAVLLAAACWGVLAVLADRAASAIHGPAGRSGASILPAAAGALIAWTVADESPLGVTCLLAICGLLLAAGCRVAGKPEPAAGLNSRFRVPAGWSCLAGPHSDWVIACTRAVMLPMMVSLLFSADWCVSAGGADRATAMGIHLAAMFLLPGLLWTSGIRMAAAWLALPMGASALMLLLPGNQGWMVASAMQSLAWGLSYVAAPGPARSEADARTAGLWQVLAAVAAVILLAAAGAAFGPVALSAFHATLGLGAVVAAIVSILSRAAMVAARSPGPQARAQTR